jgi:Asp-tRNA(Asn)/Glu-tRNA(Gln) amidotransferase A subunit family amidase
MPTEYGCPLYEGNQPNADASIIEIIRRAGALIFGMAVNFAMEVILSCCRQDDNN